MNCYCDVSELCGSTPPSVLTVTQILNFNAQTAFSLSTHRKYFDIYDNSNVDLV
jgi:hypothetical protein